MTQPECLLLILGESIVSTNIEFIHVPTCPRENRATIDVSNYSSNKRVSDMQHRNKVPQQTIREANLCHGRTFTEEQVEVILDEMHSSLKVDLITLFSVRPPELIFIREVEKYVQWFKRSGTITIRSTEGSLRLADTMLSSCIERSAWIDGLNNQLKI